MYLIIGSAVIVGAASVAVIKMLGLRTVSGAPVELRGKPFQLGTVVGGFVFGVGWAVTGACPGPIYAHIGSGETMALVSFAGAFLGAYLYASYDIKAPRVLKKRDGRFWSLYGCYPRQGGYERRPCYEGVACSDDAFV